MPKNSDARQLLRKAIDLTGLTDRQFARTRLLVNERTLRYWLAGGSRIPGAVRILCRAMVDHPVARRELARATTKVQRTTSDDQDFHDVPGFGRRDEHGGVLL